MSTLENQAQSQSLPAHDIAEKVDSVGHSGDNTAVPPLEKPDLDINAVTAPKADDTVPAAANGAPLENGDVSIKG